MKLYIYVDHSQFEANELVKIIKTSASELKAWIDSSPLFLEYVGPEPNELDAEDPAVSEPLPKEATTVEELAALTEVDFAMPEAVDFGLTLSIKNKKHLQEPLNFLNKIAQSNKCEFVVGYFNETTNKKEDVCFFGFEEGKPDLFEIANYLGL